MIPLCAMLRLVARDGVGVSMVSTFGGGWDFCSNRCQFFHGECNVILRLVGRKIG
jgi:hypothetical protein